MWVTDIRVSFRVLEGLSCLERAREEGSEQIGQSVNTARLMIVQLELAMQASQGTVDLLLIGIGESVPGNIRPDEGHCDVIVLISCQ